MIEKYAKLTFAEYLLGAQRITEDQDFREMAFGAMRALEAICADQGQEFTQDMKPVAMIAFSLGFAACEQDWLSAPAVTGEEGEG